MRFRITHLSPAQSATSVPFRAPSRYAFSVSFLRSGVHNHLEKHLRQFGQASNIVVVGHSHDFSRVELCCAGRSTCCGVYAVGHKLWTVCCGQPAVECMLWSVCCGKHAVECMLWATCCGVYAVGNMLWSVCCGVYAVGNMLWSVCCG